MKVPKVTGILLVILVSLSMLNFTLKYYVYFVLIASSSKKGSDLSSIVQKVQEVPPPHDLYIPLLTFIPTKSPVILRPWVLLTSSFIEEDIFGLLTSFACMFFLGGYLEKMWQSKEFSKYVLLDIFGTNTMVYVYYCTKRFVFGTEDIPCVVGSMSIVMGLFIALKQRIPNHYFIFFKGNLRIKVSYIPFIILCISHLLGYMHEDYSVLFLESALSFIVCWTYLRFFKYASNERQSYLLPLHVNNKKYKSRPKVFAAKSNQKSSLDESSLIQFENKTTKGDRTAQFSLDTFFPSPICLLIRPLTALIFDILSHYQLLDKKDFTNYDENDDISLDDVNSLKTGLFGLSPLKGAVEISPIPRLRGKYELLVNFLYSIPIKSSSRLALSGLMDKRRKVALKEME